MSEKILVLVRATPEESSKHNHLVCVAGINEEGEWRRLYPFEFSYGENLIDFKKRDIIKVSTIQADNDKRTESRKVIKHTNLNSQLKPDEVRQRILPLVSSIEKLSENGVSLGVIKPVLLDIDVKINSTEIYDKQAYFSMAGDFLEKREKVKMPVELRYHFKCENEPECKGHNIILIDWELNELTRSLMRKENDPQILEKKIREKFFDFMKSRDLYFFMGTHFRFGTWIIIGIFYPQLERESNQKKTVQRSLTGIS